MTLGFEAATCIIIHIISIIWAVLPRPRYRYMWVKCVPASPGVLLRPMVCAAAPMLATMVGDADDGGGAFDRSRIKKVVVGDKSGEEQKHEQPLK